MKGKPLSASRDVLVLTLPLATTGTAGWLALDDSTGDSRVGDCALVGVGCSLALSGCGDAVADAVADADGPGRPGVLGASLSEEQTFNCRVAIRIVMLPGVGGSGAEPSLRDMWKSIPGM